MHAEHSPADLLSRRNGAGGDGDSDCCCTAAGIAKGGNSGAEAEGTDGEIGKGGSRPSIGVEATAGRKRAPKASPMLASEAGIISHPRRKLARDSHIGTFAGTFAGTVAARFLRRDRRVVRAALRSHAGAEGSGVSVAEDSSVLDTWKVLAGPLFEDEAVSLASDGGGGHPV